MSQGDSSMVYSYKIQYTQYDSQGTESEVRYGTGFLVGENLMLTLPHVARSRNNGKNSKLLAYPHNSSLQDPVEFKLVESTDKLALLRCEEGTAFQGKYVPWKRAYKDINRSERATAWGFVQAEPAIIDLDLVCSSGTAAPKDKLDPEYKNERFNFQFRPQSGTSQTLKGLSGSPIIQGNRLIGILGSQMRADCTRVFGLCGEEFYKELNSLGFQYEIDQDSFIQQGLPDELPCACPKRHYDLLNKILSEENSGPVFITGPVGTGKSWLTMDYGKAYKKGHVIYMPFEGNYMKTYEAVKKKLKEKCDTFTDENPLDSLSSNDLLIIERADLPSGYPSSSLTDTWYNRLCKLRARIIITTDQPVQFKNVTHLELDRWTSSDLDYLFDRYFCLVDEKPEVSKQKEKLYSCAEYNPLILDIVLYAMYNENPDWDYHSDKLKDNNPDQYIKNILFGNDKSVKQDAMAHMGALFKHHNITDPEKKVLALVLEKSKVKKDLMQAGLKLFFKNDQYIDRLLRKGILCENPDGELYLPVVSRLMCEAEKFTVQEDISNAFDIALKIIEKEERIRQAEERIRQEQERQHTPARILLNVTDATDTVAYRAFFKKPPSISSASKKFQQELDALRQFNDTMESAYAACFSGPDYSRGVNDAFLKGYQVLCSLYPNEQEARQIFWTKYYDLFERLSPSREEMKDTENTQTAEKCKTLQTFLSVEFSDDLPNDAPRLLLLSVYHGNLNNSKERDTYAEQAKNKYDTEDPAHKHLFAHAYIQLGESANAQGSYRKAADYFKDAQGALPSLPENASPFRTNLAAFAYLRRARCLVSNFKADSADASREPEILRDDLKTAHADAEIALKLLRKIPQPHAPQVLENQIRCRSLLINIYCTQAVFSSTPLAEVEKAESLLAEMKREFGNDLKVYQTLEPKIRQCRVTALIGAPVGIS